jgi:signal transduction histidine kinase
MSDEPKPNDLEQDALIEKFVIERMGHISSELAHDLRSPLQTIQNAIYLLQKTPENPMLFDMIKASLKQATNLLDSFRDYYKAHIINPLETDITKIVDLAFSGLEIPDNIEVKRDQQEGHLLLVDPAKTAMAIRNLLINSIDAMPDGGVLEVIISQLESDVSIQVKDNGIGVPDDFVDSVFIPFESNKNGGKGLGVPTSARIIKSHGGSITFTSEHGKGTVFTVLLPRKTTNL